jgi:hypothetical protein
MDMGTYFILCNILFNKCMVWFILNKVCPASTKTRVMARVKSILELEIHINCKKQFIQKPTNEMRLSLQYYHDTPLLLIDWGIFPTVRKIDPSMWTSRAEHHEFTSLGPIHSSIIMAMAGTFKHCNMAPLLNHQ